MGFYDFMFVFGASVLVALVVFLFGLLFGDL